MPQRRYFYAFANPMSRDGEPRFAIYEDEPMRPHLEKQVTILHKRELTGRWRTASLNEIIAEFRRLRAEGNLPPTNMGAKTKPPPTPAPAPPAT